MADAAAPVATAHRPAGGRGQSRSSRPLRVAFCQHALQPLFDVMQGHSTEAAYLQQGYIAAGLRARGHALTFVAPRDVFDIECGTDLGHPTIVARTWSNRAWFKGLGALAWRTQRALGVPYLNVFSNYRRFDACLRCLAGQDLVHERNGLYNAGVAMACRRLGLPYVMFFDADQIAEHDFMGRPITGPLRWRAAQLLRFNLTTATAIVCVSDEARRQLSAQWRVPPGKIVVFPNGVDVSRFRPSAEARADIRRSHGLGEAPVLMFVGNFHAWHDVETLLLAFARLRESGTGAGRLDARLVLVGDGPNRSAMQERAAALGLTSAVLFAGPVPHAEIPRCLAAADIAIAPVPRMAQESWLSPMKVFEYMATGVAIVATEGGQTASVLEHERNALLVPAGDPAPLAAACTRLLEDAQLRERLGTRAREDALERHSWDGYVQRLEQLYAAVVSRQPFAHI